MTPRKVSAIFAGAFLFAPNSSTLKGKLSMNTMVSFSILKLTIVFIDNLPFKVELLGAKRKAPANIAETFLGVT